MANGPEWTKDQGMKKVWPDAAWEKVFGSLKSIGFFLLVAVDARNVSFPDVLVKDKQTVMLIDKKWL